MFLVEKSNLLTWAIRPVFPEPGILISISLYHKKCREVNDLILTGCCDDETVSDLKKYIYIYSKPEIYGWPWRLRFLAATKVFLLSWIVSHTK